MLVALLQALLLSLLVVVTPQSGFQTEQDVRDHVRARLSRDRVESVTIDAVELFPEGVGAARGTLR